MTSPIHGATLPEGADLRCPDRHFKDEFLVWDPEDRFHACICYGEDEVRETIAQFKDASLLRVRRTTVGELARDVTDLFAGDEEDEDRELSQGRTWARHVRSFSRPSGY